MPRGDWQHSREEQAFYGSFNYVSFRPKSLGYFINKFFSAEKKKSYQTKYLIFLDVHCNISHNGIKIKLWIVGML